MTSGGNVSISTSEPKFGIVENYSLATHRQEMVLLNPQTYSTLATIDHLRFRFYRGGDGNGCFYNSWLANIHADGVWSRWLSPVGNAALMVGLSFQLHEYYLNCVPTCAVVGDGTNIKVYRDGSLIATTPHPNWASASWFIHLGKMDDSNYSNGGMDEFLLYDGVLGLLIYTTWCLF